ncbi:MAG: penicillin-binding protein [Flexilinea flocculi]|nr:penicillin-binding protein [Flexilinea flocculi]
MAKSGNEKKSENPELKSILKKPDDEIISFRARKFIAVEEPANKKLFQSGKIRLSGNLLTIQKIIVSILFAIMGIFAVFCMIFLVWYFQVAATLPDIEDLNKKASQFETTRILDREGNLLYEIVDPNAGRRDYITLNNISPYLVAATIATEDKYFYLHPGFDIIAIIRAVFQNFRSGTTVSGASTITQQLARNILLSPEERSTRSIIRKTKEIFLAAEITRRYTKDEILELYLNENYYGSFAYGIEAAAQTYFGIPAKYLDLSQSAFLAGLPQAPGIYDVFTNYSATINRQKAVLLLIYTLSKEKGCIEVSNAPDKVCIDEMMVDKAIREIEEYDFQQTKFVMKYPHWVNYVRSLLETEYGAQTLYRSGFTVYTTIDPTMQELAQQTVSNQIMNLRGSNVQNGALVAIKPDTGEILAMVGSPDFWSEDFGSQINMAVSPRQPGSAIKPLIYAAAFEKGWTPSTLIWDVPTDFSPNGNPDELIYSQSYSPVNYDGTFHGPVLLRSALANSYNIPAVKALEFVKIYDDPTTEEMDGFINFAKRFHITTFNQADYGLSLALGGGEVTLLELTNAFSVFANNGAYVPATAIKKIINKEDEVIYESGTPEKEQIIREEYAFQMNSILSDNAARTPAFGSDSVLNLPFPVAVKTGTTNDYRDNWTVGYTPDLSVGVWIGNADYSPMMGTTGISGAAPIWSDFIRQAAYQISNHTPTDFSIPEGIINQTVCAISGTEPSQLCPAYMNEFFAYFQPPLPSTEDLWKETRINTWTGLIPNEYCPSNTIETITLNVKDIWAQRWILSTPEGNNWLTSLNMPDLLRNKTYFFTPQKSCSPQDSEPTISFTNMVDGMQIQSPIQEVFGIVNASGGIQSFSLEFGKGRNPSEWFVITNGIRQPYVYPEKIGTWNLNGIENGDYTLRIYVTSPENTYAEKRVYVNVNIDKQNNESSRDSGMEMIDIPEEGIPEFFLIE